MHSFTEMTLYLLSLPEANALFLLSERFSQDPLENYFGQQRGRAGRCDNPTITRCLQNANALCMQKSVALNPVHGHFRQKRQLSNEEHWNLSRSVKDHSILIIIQLMD